MQPLLQRVAGKLKLPLTVYTNLNSSCPESLGNNGPDPAVVLMTELRSGPGYGLSPMDLDVWLEQKVHIQGSLKLNNNELLRTIADAAASHYDPDADPMLDMLEGISLFVGQKPVPLVFAYPVRVGQVIHDLARQVVETFRKSPASNQ